MLSSIVYGTFANYSPKGRAALSANSRDACGAIKAGNDEAIRSILPHLEKANELHALLADHTTLVPVPRSAPLAAGALWPGKVIADILHGHGYGREVRNYVTRTHAVRKSSTSAGRDRPTVATHYETLQVDADLAAIDEITLVDDVLTMGRTSFACALRLHEVFPNARINVFAVMRTLGLVPDVEKITDPALGTITCHSMTGWISREP